jgi:hypothetical protein
MCPNGGILHPSHQDRHIHILDAQRLVYRGCMQFSPGGKVVIIVPMTN